MKKLICFILGHSYGWHRVNIMNMTDQNKPLWKWRGECKRCGVRTTRIPAEFVEGVNLDRYPAIKKFVKDNTR